MSLLLVLASSVAVVYSWSWSCDDMQECKGRDLTGQIYCNGYKGCEEATIGSNYDVECDGYFGCYKAVAIRTSADLSCGGKWSCRYAGKIHVDGTVTCGDYACANAAIIAGTLKCDGPGACQQVVSFNAQNIECNGQESCRGSTTTIHGQKIPLSGFQTLKCGGKQSCTFNDITGGSVECAGRDSCQGDHITADVLSCKGYTSCKGAEISAGSILVYGYKGMEASRVRGTDYNDIGVTLYGTQAGKGSKMYCQQGQTCHLFCGSQDACKKMTFYCEFGATCTISSGCDKKSKKGRYPRKTKTLQGTFCPKFTVYTTAKEEVVEEDLTDKEWDAYYAEDDTFEEDEDEVIDEDDTVGAEAVDEEKKVEEDVTRIACDNAWQCHGMTINPHSYDGSFNGMQSCLNCNINFDRRVMCNGEEACMNAPQIVNWGMPTKGHHGWNAKMGGVYCQGVRGCYGATKIEATADHKDSIIDCEGFESCAQSDRIASARDITCMGAKSCKDSSINAGESITCASTESCADSRMQYITTAPGKSDIFCTAENSCAGSSLAAGLGKVDCEGVGSCSNAIISKEKVYLRGYEVAQSATLYPECMYVYGYRAALNAQIESSYSYDMKVYLYGFKAAEGATIRCRNGHTCYITCKYMGCKDAVINAEPGSTIIMNPSACERDRTALWNKNTACPRWYGISASGTNYLDGVETPDVVVEADVNNLMMYSTQSQWNDNYYAYIGIFAVILAIGVLVKRFSKSKQSSFEEL